MNFSENPAVPAPAAAEAEVATVTPPYRLLLVEDDPDIARMILLALSQLGLECHWAQDGTTGLEAFATLHPHLVLLDIVLPDLDGREICGRIRQASAVPIIMLTALDDEESQLKSFKLGADDYVTKPFSPRLLIARVVSNLRRVYRYDIEGADELQRQARALAAGAAAVEKPLPRNWATCDACGYLGPRQKFEKENWRGHRIAVCPNCGQSEHIVFSID